MDPFIGEIRLFAGSYAPEQWALCDGSLLQIAQYDTLFSLLGTTYGGDGVTTFGLPDLRGRVPVHRSGTLPPGLLGGAETVTVAADQVSKHNHGFVAATDDATAQAPDLKAPARNTTNLIWSGEPPNVPLAAKAVGPSPGGGQPHENMHPFQVITYIISLAGVYPSRPEE